MLAPNILRDDTVTRSADQVRITAQLVEPSADRNLWAESYGRKLSEVLALQREVARNVADEIRITTTPAEQARLAAGGRVDPEGNDFVLRAMYFANKATEHGLRQGLEYAQKAVVKDPNYAPGRCNWTRR